MYIYTYKKRERKIETERERERDTEGEKERDRERKKGRERERERERQRDSIILRETLLPSLSIVAMSFGFCRRASLASFGGFYTLNGGYRRKEINIIDK